MMKRYNPPQAIVRILLCIGLLLQMFAPLMSVHAQPRDGTTEKKDGTQIDNRQASTDSIISSDNFIVTDLSLPRLQQLAGHLTVDRGQVEIGETVDVALHLSNLDAKAVGDGYNVTVTLADGLHFAGDKTQQVTSPLQKIDTDGETEHAFVISTAEAQDGNYPIVAKVFTAEGLIVFATSAVVTVGQSNPNPIGVTSSLAEGDPEPVPWEFRPIAPAPSTFSLAATYGYPIETPPARGGIGPQLGLSYSSRSVDSFGYRDSGVAGHGWSLNGLPFIQKNNVGLCSEDSGKICSDHNLDYIEGGEDPHPWTLYVGGQGYLLRKVYCDDDSTNNADCIYHAYDGPGLYIDRLEANNYAMRVRTPDGTVYYFGGGWDNARSDELLQKMAPVNGTPGLPGGAIYKYLLDHVEDADGNVMAINYAEHQMNVDVGEGREVQIRPVTILYNNNVYQPFNPDVAPVPNPEVEGHWDSKIKLNWAPTTRTQNYTGASPLQFTAYHLTEIEAFQRTVGWEKVWGYELEKTLLTHSDNPNYANNEIDLECLADASCWVTRLDSIKHTNATGAAINTVSFTYVSRSVGQVPAEEWCEWAGHPGLVCGEARQHANIPLLSMVENGYGGVYRFEYNEDLFQDYETSNDPYQPNPELPNYNVGRPGGDFINYTVKTFAVWDGVEHVYPTDSATHATRFWRGNEGSDQSDPDSTPPGFPGFGVPQSQGYHPCRTQINGYCENDRLLNSVGLPGAHLSGYRFVWSRSFEDYDFINKTGTLLGETHHEFLVGTSDPTDTSTPSLYGRPVTTEQYDANGTLISRTSNMWADSEYDVEACPRVGGDPQLYFNAHWACLVASSQSLYAPDNSIISTVERDFEYLTKYQRDANLVERQWGLQTGEKISINSEEYVNNQARFASNLDADDWVIQPWLTGTWLDADPDEDLVDWDVAQLSLMLYDGQLDPNNQTLTRDSQLTYSAVISDVVEYNDVADNGGTSNLTTVFSKVEYDSEGRVDKTIAYQEYGVARSTRNGGVYDWLPVILPPANSAVVSTVGYDSEDRVTEVTNPLGHVSRFGYVSGVGNGYPWQLETMSQFYGDGSNPAEAWTTEYEYDTFGRLSATYLPTNDGTQGPDVRYNYNLGNPTTTISQESYPDHSNTTIQGTAQNTFDGLGRLIESRVVAVPNENTGGLVDLATTYAYDGAGRVICESLPQRIDTVGDAATACLDTDNHNRTFYDAAGRPEQVISADGLVSTMQYTNYADNSLIGLSALGGHTQVIAQLSENNETLRCNIQTYNDKQQLIWIGEWDEADITTSNCLNERFAITAYGYDNVGNLVAVERGGHLHNGTYTNPTILQTTIQYDDFGRKTQMDDPDMGVWTYNYDEAGNLVRQVGGVGTSDQVVTCAAYDVIGRITNQWLPLSGTNCGNAETDPNSDRFLAEFTYDDTFGSTGLGQLEEVRWNPQIGAAGLTGVYSDTFTYDGFGRIETHTRTINDKTFTQEVLTYDEISRATAIKNAAGETVTTTYDNWGGQTLDRGSDALITNVTYNTRGQQIFLDRGNQISSDYNYKGVNAGFRLRDVTVAKGGINLVTYDYDYDSLGQITSIDSTLDGVSESEQFTYDTLGRLTTASATGSGNDYSLSYGYDNLSNLTSVTDVLNGNAQTLYHNTGSFGDAPPHAVGAMAQNGVTYNFDYDELGRMTVRETASGTFTQTFDELGRLTEVEHNNGETTYFGYDTAGIRVIAQNPDGTVIYTPFADYQLEERAQSAIGGGGNGVPSADAELTISVKDSANNPMTVQNLCLVEVTGSALTDFWCQNHTDAATFTLPSSPSGTKYGAAALPYAGDTIEGAYVSEETPLGNFNDQIHNGNLWAVYLWATWDDAHYSMTFTEDSVATIEHVTYTLDGMAVATQVTGDPEGDDGLYWMHGDHVGSLTLITDINGDIVDETKAKFLPFGDYRQEPISDLSDKGFTGHRENRNIGLTYMNARYYDSQLRRFISADTLIPEPDSTLGWNRFAYVNNNPINFIDPSGHCSMETLPDGSYKEQECHDEYHSLIRAGAPVEILGSLQDYQRRDDYDLLIGLHQDYGLPWDVILNNTWSTWGDGDIKDDRVCANPAMCGFGYTPVVVNGRKVCLADSSGTCIDDGQLYFLFHCGAGEGARCNGQVATKAAASEFMANIDEAKLKYDRFLTEAAFGLAYGSICVGTSVSPVGWAACFGALLMAEESYTHMMDMFEYRAKARQEWDFLWEAENLSIMSGRIVRFDYLYVLGGYSRPIYDLIVR